MTKNNFKLNETATTEKNTHNIHDDMFIIEEKKLNCQGYQQNPIGCLFAALLN